MSFKEKSTEIFEKYYAEYQRPFDYIDPRNLSKASDQNLFNEHNQTVNFCNAVRMVYPNSIAWYELSVGITYSEKHKKNGTNAIDGIVYIPEENTLLVIEAKGLRKESKFIAITNDLKRTIGELGRNETDDYKIQIERPQHMYAVTLADIWSGPDENAKDEWKIDFESKTLSSQNKCKEKYFNKDYGFKTLADKNKDNVIWDSSEPFKPYPKAKAYRLLVMLYKMSETEINSYKFKE